MAELTHYEITGIRVNYGKREGLQYNRWAMWGNMMISKEKKTKKCKYGKSVVQSGVMVKKRDVIVDLEWAINHDTKAACGERGKEVDIHSRESCREVEWTKKDDVSSSRVRHVAHERANSNSS